MTMQEYILAKSYLPKNGTYTMMDHLQAMEMTVIGDNQRLVIANKISRIKVSDKIEIIKIGAAKDPIVIKDSKFGIVLSKKTQG